MKHIFIINPEAGKRRAEKEFLPAILKAVRKTGVEYEVHRAMSPESGVSFVRTHCRSGEPIRFYAVGGDGTLNGILNGIVGYENAELACIPAGTGNDFIRNFKHNKHFSSVERQIQGKAAPVDVLKFNGAYAINMLNIGIDCSVVGRAGELKKKPMIGGSGAYLGGIAQVFFKGAHFPLRLEFEGGEVLCEDFLLTAVANGSFCGGGFKAAPRARMTDGFFDVCIVRQIGRKRLIPLMAKYKAGAHLEDAECRKYLTYKQCQRVSIFPAEEGGRLIMSADGEIESYGSVEVEIVKSAVRFSVPEGCSFSE